MVRVQIPVDTPIDEDEDDAVVGIMSSGESDVDDDIGDPDWDEVKNKDSDDEPSPAIDIKDLPANGVTISITRPKRGGKRGRSKKKGPDGEEEDDESEDENPIRAKKRKELDIGEMVRKSINRLKITEQLIKHKMSLLIYLARGMRLIKIINCNIIRGLALSIVESKFKIKSKKSDMKFLKTFLDQFGEIIQLTSDEEIRSKHAQQPFMLNLLACFSDLQSTSLIELVVMFCSCMKVLRPNLPMRLVNVLRPITLRANIILKGKELPEVAESEQTQIKEEEVEVIEDVREKEEPQSKPKKKKKEKKSKPKIELPEVIELDHDVIEKLDFWVEVFIDEENRWICIDLCNLKLDEPNVLTELSRPFNYLVSYDIDRRCVKAAEKYYCENWYTPAFRKGRCEDKWWDSVMDKLGPTKANDKDQADDTKTDELLVKQDMPTSDSGFRNHPLYVLQKHLLKFQVIYPPEVAPLGFFKDQPVYPRDCVQTCRSRETWLRQARTVKLGETPYKIVKARPKRDKYTGDLIRDLPLELFGEWQTQDYDPPEAKNGKVPRNCYGNVDMYQECMLPKGCAWLKLPGLQRIANKLGIDCAAAVVGFDNHCGAGYGSHPVIDGFIVCAGESSETLQLAWEEEQVNARKREEEKRSKRIWDNWKRLIKASMIREKLRVKYKNS